ncbi:histidine kinase [Solirubrobacter ginsenosidimutans]|uniref:histidine kinase n=1 Tax=Solirubrobacter ginsenosidimutans TaxID=490573 RepID=A0A9X3S310_9ACTN|nr:sensor histidine kinase [Solirubrobacter ginsenosidimutans]MDA0161641.1 histidine kinase [Solirubrobacter ginsenosidimutans]
MRLATLLRRHPLIGDAALVAGLLAVGLLSGGGDIPDSGASRAFTIALALPLLVRRRRPVLAFAAIAAIAFIQWLCDVRAFGDAALLIALYSVAVAEPTRTTVAAVGVVEAGILLAVLRWSEGPGHLYAFVGLSGLATAAAVFGTSTRNRRALLISLHERAERLERERDQQGRLAAAAERARIAREMHDVIAHNVSVMIALADGATYAMEHEPERAEHAMRTASRTGRQALTEMRRLLGVLREDHDPAQLAPQPGLRELDELLQDVRTAGLPVSYEVSGSPEAPLPPGLQLAVYRIVQEALTNTLKHAGPGASARLRVHHGPEAIEVEVVDTADGPAPHPPGDSGAGLRGMRERAAVYEGLVEAGPGRDGGWQVRLTVPLLRSGAPV